MFPLADARGRVVGFGARAMRENQPPKYLNTSEGEVFHKGSQLFGIDLARKAAARAGTVVLAEGYTDVLALHQAGTENAVGIMGTSFTDEQARELERTARTLVLALDADGAGQEAMLRAARVAEGRSLELRVVALPAGKDPADLVQQEGVDAVQARICRSVPFVSFYVERTLDKVAASDVETRGRAFMEDIGPILIEFAGDPAKAPLRAELEQHAASRLAISKSVAESMLQSLVSKQPQPVPARQQQAPAAPDAPSALGGGFSELIARRDTAERTFLALCAAFPREGGEWLAQAELDEHFTSDVLRRAAVHLRSHLTNPLDDLPEHDNELSTAISEVAARAAHNGSVTADNLEHAWLALELARLERAIELARASGVADGSVSTLSREREQVRTQLRLLSGKLQSA